MDIDLAAGRYVVAVSGGVDSGVLLNLLHHKKILLEVRPLKSQFQFVVAHFDHGIREDSGEDRKFVEQLAGQYDLPFFYEEGNLGAAASEALARQKRYEFLNKVRLQTGASAMITAHHQDDLIETAIINIIRGTGRKGLSSLKSSDLIKRPLLGFSKLEIQKYALKNNLTWREDPTNQDEKYLRNYVRRQIIDKFLPDERKSWLDKLNSMQSINKSADYIIGRLLAEHSSEDKLDRLWFASLPHDVSKELLATWFRLNGARFDRRQLERLTILCKTRAPGKRLDVDKYDKISIEHNYLALARAER
ncbi:MAG: tRNA lysidine(34) synthetase TilS [Candidatus Saccharimonadales bacterium]